MSYQFKNFRATKPVARLIDSNAGTYEAFFIVYDMSGKKIPCRFSKGINNLPRNERIHQARAKAYVLWEALQKGWNPLKEKYPNWLKDETAAPLSFSQALQVAMDLKRPALSKYSVYDYEGCVRFMNEAARDNGHHDTDIQKIERRDIRMIIATAKELNEWSSNARNKYLTILKALLSVLVDEDRLKYNPAHGIKNEVSTPGNGYKRLTDEQKEKIAIHLLDKAPDYFEYLMFIYQSGIRRKELLMIKLSDINLQRRQITIRPEVAKTNRERTVPITDDLFEILIRRQVFQLPQSYFLFSSDKFMPGEKPYHPNTPTLWWRKLVQDPVDNGGLGIDCKMYSLKHKGADDKIEAGMDLDVLRTLYGHRSKQMTEIYARAVRDRYEQQIIVQSPVFAKVVQLNKKMGG
jgi:integrase